MAAPAYNTEYKYTLCFATSPVCGQNNENKQKTFKSFCELNNYSNTYPSENWYQIKDTSC